MMKLGFRVAGCVGEMFLHLCSSILFYIATSLTFVSLFAG
jgi:hypothetical protein